MAGPTLDELIAGARSAERPHRDVDITLDTAVAAQIEALDARMTDLEQEVLEVAATADVDLAEATRDARLGSPQKAEIEKERDAKIAALEDQIADLAEQRGELTDGTMLKFRFTQIPGQAWAEIASRHPARVDVTIDRVYGYNYHETAKAAAAYRDPGKQPGQPGRAYAERVIPPESEDTEETLEPITAEQWAGIFEVITGHEFERIASAIWDLNDYGPQQRIAAAGKASRAGSASRSSSPARSEPARSASPDGSPSAP